MGKPVEFGTSVTAQASILLVEGNRNLNAGLARLLLDAGYEVEVAERSADALEMFKSAGFKLVIIDYDIDGGGLVLAETLKASETPPHIILTSRVYRSFSDGAAKNLPVDTFIPQPFPHFELLDQVHSLLSKGKLLPDPSRTSANLPLRGELDDFPFESLLHKLFSSKFTGRLVMQHRKASKVIYFLRGFPSSATSNTHAEALGTLLVNRGFVRNDDLTKLLENMSETSKTLGQQLIDAGLITREQLKQTLDEQVRERVLACFEMRGSWVLYPGDSFAFQQEHHIQNPIELIFYGISRFEETNTLAERIQERVQHYAVPTRQFSRLLPYFPAGENRKKLFLQIDGNTTVGELLASWQGETSSFFRVIWSMHAARLIFMSQSPMPSAPQPIEKLLSLGENIGSFLNFRSDPVPQKFGTSSVAGVPTAQKVDPLQPLLDLENKTQDMNHFEVFGLSVLATPLEIRSAVERLVKLLDPKLVGHLTPEKVRRVAKIGRWVKQAASVLLDPDTREEYRATLSGGTDESEIEQGIRLIKQRRLQEARDLFEAIERHSPSNSRACAYLGRVLHLIHGPGDARMMARSEALIHRAVMLDEGNSDAHYFLADIYADTGDEPQAQKHAHKAIELNPTHEAAIALRNRLGQGVGLGTVRIGPWLFKNK